MLANKTNPRRGSILIAALIVAILTASMVGVYLSSVTQEVKLAHKARMDFQAVNVAEAGIEFALASLQNGDWSEWESSTNGFYRDTFPYINYQMNRENRQVRVYVEPHATPPAVLAEGIITHANGMEAHKQVYVQLGQRSLFANGLLSKNGVTLNGNTIWIDSYASANGPYDAATNSNDNGSVASLSVEVGSVAVDNADVFGRVATGGAWPEVGPNGSITGKDTPSGVTVDQSRVALDFYASLPDPEKPELASPSTSVNATIGSSGTTSEYKISSLDIKNNETFAIEGDVTMVVEGDIDVKGQLRLNPGASLQLFVDGDMTIGGTGIVNVDGAPPNLLVYGTGSDKEFKLHGSASFAGAVYAPNNDVSLKGGGSSGEMFGAAVGDTIVIVGNYSFHYDESLADMDNDDGIRVSQWEELTTAARRQNMNTILENGFSDALTQ